MTTYVLGMQVFFLIYVRVISFFVSSPFWSNPLLMFRFKNIIALLVSYILVLIIMHQVGWKEPISMSFFWLLLLQNGLIGLMMGFFLTLLFSIFQIVGEIWGLQIGFSMAQVFDPLTGDQSPILGQLIGLIAVMLFVTLEGHLRVILLLQESFQNFPVDGINIHWDAMLKNFIVGITVLFKNSIILSLTLMGSIFITTLFVGLIAKAAPQLNVMLFGMPVYMIIGFVVLLFLVPNFIYFAGNYIRNSLEQLYAFMTSVIQ